MAPDLIFSQPSQSTAHLVFGGAEVLPTHFEATLSATLPPLQLRARITPVTRLTLTATLPGALSLAASITYHTNTQRPTVARLHSSAQVATVIEGGITQPQQHAQATTTATQASMTEATRASAASSTGFANATDSISQLSSGFEDAMPTRATTHASMQDGDPQWLRFISQFQEAASRSAAPARSLFQDGLRDRRRVISSQFQDATHRTAARYQGRAGAAVALKRYLDSVFQDARVPPVGITRWPLPPVIPPPYWGPVVVLQCPPLSHPTLVFPQGST